MAGWTLFLCFTVSCAAGEDVDVGRDFSEVFEPPDTWQDLELLPEADLPPEAWDWTEDPAADLLEPPPDAPDITVDDAAEVPVDEGPADTAEPPDLPDSPDIPDTPDIPDIADADGCDPSVWHGTTASDTPISIPDMDPAGITSWIDVADCDFEVLDIRVAVNIQHTYIGDLRVALLGPDGRSAVLHNLTGGGSSNINTTYPTLTAPAQTLCRVIRQPSLGRWGLAVSDNESWDTGQLVSWTLELTGVGGSCSADAWYPTGTFPISIPDSNPTGISSTANVTATGSITSIAVGVDITHSYIGDLIVSIHSPGGTARMLHNRTGGSSSDIHTTYPTLTTPAESLDVFIGTERAGTWTLTASDNASMDTGTLDDWVLEIR